MQENRGSEKLRGHFRLRFSNFSTTFMPYNIDSLAMKKLLKSYQTLEAHPYLAPILLTPTLLAMNGLSHSLPLKVHPILVSKICLKSMMLN